MDEARVSGMSGSWSAESGIALLLVLSAGVLDREGDGDGEDIFAVQRRAALLKNDGDGDVVVVVDSRLKSEDRELRKRFRERIGELQHASIRLYLSKICRRTGRCYMIVSYKLHNKELSVFVYEV